MFGFLKRFTKRKDERPVATKRQPSQTYSGASSNTSNDPLPYVVMAGMTYDTPRDEAASTSYTDTSSSYSSSDSSSSSDSGSSSSDSSSY